MATYAIGDIQGCFETLLSLLKHIQFDPKHDNLWLAGDLINRGPQSLETLRFIKNLGNKQQLVLGNHDLHLLAVHHGVRTSNEKDTLNDILKAPDRDELMHWLSHQPLLVEDKTLGYVMVHAGIAPAWNLQQAKQYAKEVELLLQGEKAIFLLKNMYGNYPDLWSDDLEGIERARLIVNYFTRMRYCDLNGRLDLTYQGDLSHKPENLIPWFKVPTRKPIEIPIIFGHFAALMGETNTADIYALDTGCVWGHRLTAMRLEDKKLFSVPSVSHPT